MAKYYIQKINGEREYIKDIDFANQTLTFTTSRDEAYEGRDGYYADATRDMIRTNFKEDYPQVSELCTDYY